MISELALVVGLPYLVLLGGALVTIVGISIRRTHDVALVLTVLTLIASLLSHVPVMEAIPEGGLAVTDLARLDGLAVFFNLLFLLTALVTALIAEPVIRALPHKEEFYLLLMTATFGAMVMAAATHFMAFILGMEILSISLYGMIAYPPAVRPPLEAAVKYLVLSGVASTTILFGMALTYGASGSMEFSDTILSSVGRIQNLYLIGQAFIWVGIAFKLSLVPFHMWTPDVYQGAPSVVTGFIATVSKGAMFVLILRYVFESDVLHATTVFWSLSALACVSMIVGNILALMQRNIKRILAYSSIAHMGYLMIAVLIMSSARPAIAIEAMMFYLGAYFLISVAAFGIVSMASVEGDPEAEQLDHFRGLFWRNPAIAAVLTAAALSLAGIPLTVGFIAKFYIFVAGIEGSTWILIWALVISSAIGVFYYLRIIYTMSLPVDEDVQPLPRMQWLGGTTIVALGLAMFYLGVYPTPLVSFIKDLISLSGV